MGRLLRDLGGLRLSLLLCQMPTRVTWASACAAALRSSTWPAGGGPRRHGGMGEEAADLAAWLGWTLATLRRLGRDNSPGGLGALGGETWVPARAPNTGEVSRTVLCQEEYSGSQTLPL